MTQLIQDYGYLILFVIVAAESSGIPKAARAIVRASDIGSAWGSLEVADRREIIRVLVDIYIDPPGRGAVKFRPETVRIEWLN